MGRRIWIEIFNNNGQKVWDSSANGDHFYGYNQSTDVIANSPRRITSEDNNRVQFDEWEDYHILRINLKNEQKRLDQVLAKLNIRIEDAREARRHASTVDAFYDFTALMEELIQQRDDTCWTYGDDMLSLMDSAIAECVYLINDFNNADFYAQDSALNFIHSHGWHLYWVISE